MSSNFNLKRATETCRAGGVIAYPTESVYGLGCDPLNYFAVNKILSLKQRPLEKGLILIAAHLEQLKPFTQLDQSQIEKILTHQQKPITWLVPKSDLTPYWISGSHQKVAIRITQHPVAKQLCEYIGHPIVSTSANKSNSPPARTSLKVRIYFGDLIDCVISGRTGLIKNPTEIRDIDSDSVIRVC